MYEAFYEYVKGVICPEESDESRWIKNEGNDPADKINKIESVIRYMEIATKE